MGELHHDGVEEARAAVHEAEALMPNAEIAAALAELRADIANGESLDDALRDLRRAIAHAS